MLGSTAAGALHYLILHVILLHAAVIAPMPGVLLYQMLLAVTQKLRGSTGFSPVEVFRKYLWFLLRERKFDAAAVEDMVLLKGVLGLSDEQVCCVHCCACCACSCTCILLTVHLGPAAVIMQVV
jgi:hypothetical protein